MNEQDMNGSPPESDDAAAEDEGKKKKKSRLRKRILRKVAITIVPWVARKWLWLYDYIARSQGMKRLSMVNYGPLMERLRDQNQPTIVALWHNRLFFGPTAYEYVNGDGAVVMVSRSFDGDVIAKSLQTFRNLHAVRGSSRSKKGRDKGGREALEKMIEMGQKGFDLCITPDGPQGPRYEIKRGIIDLASITGYPIYPSTASAKTCIEMKSWDRTKLPIPGSPCVYIVADPITVPPDADEETIEQKRQELQKVMMEITERADHFYDKK